MQGSLSLQIRPPHTSPSCFVHGVVPHLAPSRSPVAGTVNALPTFLGPHPTSALARFPTAKTCIFVSEDCPQTHKKASLPAWQSRSTQEIAQSQEQPSNRLQGHECPKALTSWRNESGACVYIVSQSFSVGLNPYCSRLNNTILLVTFSWASRPHASTRAL